jgi:hypothetical protein
LIAFVTKMETENFVCIGKSSFAKIIIVLIAIIRCLAEKILFSVSYYIFVKN